MRRRARLSETRGSAKRDSRGELSRGAHRKADRTRAGAERATRPAAHPLSAGLTRPALGPPARAAGPGRRGIGGGRGLGRLGGALLPELGGALLRLVDHGGQRLARHEERAHRAPLAVGGAVAILVAGREVREEAHRLAGAGEHGQADLPDRAVDRQRLPRLRDLARDPAELRERGVVEGLAEARDQVDRVPDRRRGAGAEVERRERALREPLELQEHRGKVAVAGDEERLALLLLAGERDVEAHGRDRRLGHRAAAAPAPASPAPAPVHVHPRRPDQHEPGRVHDRADPVGADLALRAFHPRHPDLQHHPHRHDGRGDLGEQRRDRRILRRAVLRGRRGQGQRGRHEGESEDVSPHGCLHRPSRTLPCPLRRPSRPPRPSSPVRPASRPPSAWPARSPRARSTPAARSPGRPRPRPCLPASA